MTKPTVQPTFEPGPDCPQLSGGEVHLWRAQLDEPMEGAANLLSPPEWLRAERFHFRRDRQRFIAGRALLRTVLARYVGGDPRDLEFSSGPHGKPELVGSALRFNVSHSGDLFLLALTYGREVGVDVEEMREHLPFEMLADHYFEPEDAWNLRLLEAPEKASRFYDLWTGKEAQLKAGGTGLAHGPHVPAPERWSLLSLRPADGFAGALAIEGGHYFLKCWSWR